MDPRIQIRIHTKNVMDPQHCTKTLKNNISILLNNSLRRPYRWSRRLICLLPFEAALTSFFKKIKCHKDFHKTVGTKVSLTIFASIIEGSGSGRPKNIWILRIRIHNIESIYLLKNSATIHTAGLDGGKRFFLTAKKDKQSPPYTVHSQ